jgi:hypothetical protein
MPSFFGLFKKSSKAPVVDKDRAALRKDFEKAGVFDSLDDLEAFGPTNANIYDRIFADLKKRIILSPSKESYVIYFVDTKEQIVFDTIFCDYNPKEKLYKF